MKKIIFFASLFVSNNVFANDSYIGSQTGLATILNLILSVGVLIGLILIMEGLYGFYGRTNNPNQYTIKSSIWKIFSGLLLVISTTTYAWAINTVAGPDWATDNTLLAIGSNIADTTNNVSGSFLGKYLPEQTIATLMGFMYLSGTVALVKGIYLLKNIGAANNHEGGLGKALCYLIGGSAVINIVKVSCFISWLFGIPVICLGS